MTESLSQPGPGNVRRLLGIGLLLTGVGGAALFGVGFATAVQDVQLSMLGRCGLASLGVLFVIALLGVATAGHFLFTGTGQWYRDVFEAWTKTLLGQLVLVCACLALTVVATVGALSGQAAGFMVMCNAVGALLWCRIGVKISKACWRQWVTGRAHADQGPAVERIP